MDDYWLRALRAAEEAEEAARRLRRRYGREAEAHLSDAAAGVETLEDRRAKMDDVRRALRWT
jgi:hypothetical protein